MPIDITTIHSSNVCQSQKLQKNHKNPKFWEFNVIGVGTPGKMVSSACYDKQQDCVYQQPSSR